MTPKDSISHLINEAINHRNQAEQALSLGIHADGAPIVGDLLIKTFMPHGTKRLARAVGKSIRKTSKSNVSTQWRQAGDQFLSQCESFIKKLSINVKTLSLGGNSSRLIRKFNRARRLKNPVPFFNTLIIVLEEIKSQDLIWNEDIPIILKKRKAEKEQKRNEKAALKASSPKLIRLAQTIELYNKLQISEKLEPYPNVQQSVLGALDCFYRGGPDAERQCIVSCRASIEALCIQAGKNADWKTALNMIFPSETDRRAIKGVWNYLSGKGAHGGHIPTKEETEYALKITIATLEQIANIKRE